MGDADACLIELCAARSGHPTLRKLELDGEQVFEEVAAEAQQLVPFVPFVRRVTAVAVIMLRA